MRTNGLAVAALILICLAGFASLASAEKGDMKIRFGVLYSSPTGSFSDSSGTAEFDAATGFQAGFEYYLTNLIGIEPALGAASYDLLVSDTGVPEFTFGDVSGTTLTVNLNFHLLKGEGIDFYLGPTVGYGFWSDFTDNLFGEEFPVESEFLLGANLGVDVPFGKSKWGFNGVLNYLQSEIKFEDADPDDPVLPVDPLQLKAGVYYRF